MPINCGTFGMAHKPNEKVVCIEMNREQLLDYRDSFSKYDCYRDDLRKAIDAIGDEEGEEE